MIDKLDFLVRYWELNARNASMGVPLEAHERSELLSLMQFVTDQEIGLFSSPQAGTGMVARPKDAFPAQMIGDGTILRVEIRSVAAGGVVVSSASAVPEGALVVLRASDAITGLELVLPCRVAWVHRGAPMILALTVDGIPKRTVFAGIPDLPLRMPLRLGKHERLLG